MAEAIRAPVIVDQPIDLTELLSSVERRGNGAVLLFVGTVRDFNEGRLVTGIRYDAYREMAESVLRDIIREAGEGHENCVVGAVHRVGELEVGAASVAIAVSTPHRADSFEACRYIIEQIKVRLPVWKHERYVGGESGWVAGADPATEVQRT